MHAKIQPQLCATAVMPIKVVMVFYWFLSLISNEASFSLLPCFGFVGLATTSGPLGCLCPLC